MNCAQPHNVPRGPRHNRRGFAVAAVLYLLGLIGVIGGVLYSGNMQTIRSVMTVQNSLSVRSDLQAATTTLSAEAVFSTDNQTLCPPRSIHQTSGDPCATAPVALTQLGDLGTDPHLPANAATASASGAPVEVGVFTAGAGLKQLDPSGHYYIYCRWENSRSTPAAPALVILSAGPDGNLQTKCGDSVAQGDDSLTMLTVGEAINRAALWQSDASNNVSYGSTGSKVTIDSNGDLNAAGNITAAGSLNGASAAITNGITASSLTTTGNISGGTGSFGDISGSSLEISGAATIGGTTTLGVLNAQASTLDSLTVTHDATIGGGLTIQGGDLVLANGYSYAQIDSTGNSRRLIALSPTNDILLGGHNGTGNIYFLTNNSTVGYVDVAGDLDMSGNIVGVNGTFSGNSTATNYTASDTVTGVTGNFQNLNANNLTAGNTAINGTLSVTGQTTGSSASYTGTVTAASFNGTMTLGGSGGVTISGVVPIANGGTGASSAAAALNNLGVTSGGVFNTGLLTAGLINGGYLTSGTVTSAQLNATGVTAGNCPSPTVGVDGRITACGTSVTATAAGSTGDIQFNNAGSFAATNGLYWDNTHGYLGIGTSSPAGILDVEGGKAAASATGTNINLAAQSGGTGNTNGGNIYLTPGAGSGTGYAGSVLIGSGCSSMSWMAYGLCATGDILSQTGFATASFQPYGWGTSSAQITGVGGGTTGDQIRFLTNNAERGRFDGSGHFAVGTINPLNTLDVSGAVAIGTSYAGIKTAPANSLIVQGNVGIGTAAPDSQLEVYGTLPSINLLSSQNAGKEYQFVNDGNYAYVKDSTDALGEFRLRSNANNDVARFSYAGPAGSFVLSSNGYVGIGTATPAAALDVYGGIDLKGINGISYPTGDSTLGGSIAIGNAALNAQSTTSGTYDNIAIGHNALKANTTGQYNVALGYNTLAANTTYFGNTAVGYTALAANANNGNTAFGYRALAANTNGSINTALGENALLGNTSGTSNVAVGAGAMMSNTSGGSNVVVGMGAMPSSTSGGGNVVLGYDAGNALSTGSQNVIIGFQVGLFTLQTGTNNILIGNSTAVDVPAASTSNFLNIGNTVYATGMGSSPKVGIGTAAPAATLDVAGFMRLAKSSSAPATCSATNEGAIALTSQHTLCVCNGTAWAGIADGSTACAWTGSTPSSPVQIVLSTAGAGTWTVPANWNSSNNKIEVVGAGAGGASFNFTSAGSVGGGAGAYSNITNLSLTPGATINYSIGTGGTGETSSSAAQSGSDTWFNATVYASASVAAKGGSGVSNGNTGGVGGAAASGIGTTKNSGGNGGNSGTNNAGAGGGGAGGPDGNGVIGVAGASGSSSTGGAGGAGDNGSDGAGGIGGTSSSKNGSTGSSGTISGGGGGGGYASGGNGGNGGLAGAGGGGGGSGSSSTNGGQGANGQIIITYTP